MKTVNLHIVDSYDIWSTIKMKSEIQNATKQNYGSEDPESTLNRSYASMYIEWWLHNIGYYLTKPFCRCDYIHKLNLRFKDVDLEEWKCERSS